MNNRESMWGIPYSTSNQLPCNYGNDNFKPGGMLSTVLKVTWFCSSRAGKWFKIKHLGHFNIALCHPLCPIHLLGFPHLTCMLPYHRLQRGTLKLLQKLSLMVVWVIIKIFPTLQLVDPTADCVDAPLNSNLSHVDDATQSFLDKGQDQTQVT